MRTGPGTQPAEPLRLATPAGRAALAATVLGSSLALLDGTVVTVALPTLGAELDASIAALQWVVNGYTLSLAALILLGGSLGDRYGRRRIFLVGVVWFALASLLCGVAQDVSQLVAARLLQGVGAALLTPGSLAIIQASFVRDDRGRAIGAWSALGGVSTAVGPFLGGWLVDAVSWRWIFLLNVPVAVVTVVVTLRAVPETRDPATAGARADLAGVLLGALSLALLTYGLVRAGEAGGPLPLLVAALGLAGLLGFALVEARGRAPMLPVELFTERRFTVTNLVTLLVYAALGGQFFLLVVALQVVAGFSAVLAGAALLPVTVVMLLLSSAAGELGQRIGPRLPMTVGPLVTAVGALLLLAVGPGSSYVADVLPGATVVGLGLAVTVAPLTATVLDAAPERHAGVASGVNNAVARTGSLLAVAALPLLIGLSGTDYRDPQLLDAGLTRALLICAGLYAAGGLLAFVGLGPPPRTAHAPSVAGRTHCALDAPPLEEV